MLRAQTNGLPADRNGPVGAQFELRPTRLFRGIRGRVLPVVWWHDLGFDAGVLAEQVQQVRPVNKLDRLVLGEVEAGLAVAGGGEEDSLAGAFVLPRSEPVPDC